MSGLGWILRGCGFLSLFCVSAYDRIPGSRISWNNCQEWEWDKLFYAKNVLEELSHYFLSYVKKYTAAF